MPEPIADRLSRFTPDTSGLDRDALLFAAGGISARPNRVWQALAGLLIATQVLTLILLWAKSPPVSVVGPAAANPEVFEFVPIPPTSDGAELWSMHRRMYESDGNYVPPAVPGEFLVPAGPPLRAFPLN